MSNNNKFVVKNGMSVGATDVIDANGNWIGPTTNLNADLLDGQHGSYYLDWNNTTNKPDPVVTVTLTGDVTGTANATLTDLASGTASIATTIAPNSVALGTDTTGNYVADVTAGSGITVSGTAGEGWTPIIGHADTSSVANLVSDNLNNTVIQDINFSFDTYGHVTGASVGTTTISSVTDAYNAVIQDTRAAQLSPNDYVDYRATWEFTDKIVGGWHSVMTLQGWHNNYAAWQIIGPSDTATHENWYLRSGVNSTWGSLREILHSGNYADYVGNGAFTVTAGSGLIGGGQLGTANQSGATSVTLSHDDTSSVTNQANEANVFVSGINFDTYGHVLSVTRSSPTGFLTSESDTLATVTARGASTSTAVTLSSAANHYSGHFYLDAYDAAGNHYPHFLDGSSGGGVDINWRLFTGAINSHTHIWNTVTAQFVTKLESTVRVDAPIFYDNNDTAYYGDFASTSVINNLNVAGTMQSTNGNGAIRLYGNLHIDAYNGNDIYLNYYGARRTRAYVGTSEKFRVDTDGIVYAFDQFRTPIVYDTNNTGYYVDPNGTSVLNALTVNSINASSHSHYLGAVADTALDTATGNGFYTVNYTGYSRSLLSWNASGSVGPVQLLVHYGNNGIQYRNKTDSTTWSAWKTFLTDTNYTSYVGNGAMSVTAGTDLAGGGQVGTANQSNATSVTVNHADITRTNTTSTASPARNGSFTVVDSVTTNARGHVTAVNTKTVTLPDFEIVTFSESLTLTTSWQDTTINATDLSTGTYIVQVSANDNAVGGTQYWEVYSGVMSWYSGNTNSDNTDEITLHRAGHAPNSGTIFLRVQRTFDANTSDLKLQIAGTTNNTGASTYTFKFRQMI